MYLLAPWSQRLPTVDSTVQKDMCTIREGNICIEVEAQTFSLPMVKCSDTTPNSKHHTGFLSQCTNRTTTTEAGVGNRNTLCFLHLKEHRAGLLAHVCPLGLLQLNDQLLGETCLGNSQLAVVVA